MIAILLSPSGRAFLAAAGLAAFVALFALDQQQRGAEKAVAKIEKATNNAISKAQSAGARSRQPGSGGMQLPHYRD